LFCWPRGNRLRFPCLLYQQQDQKNGEHLGKDRLIPRRRRLVRFHYPHSAERAQSRVATVVSVAGFRVANATHPSKRPTENDFGHEYDWSAGEQPGHPGNEWRWLVRTSYTPVP
jgi:hypothetical protein